jgi:hypothetical protein
MAAWRQNYWAGGTTKHEKIPRRNGNYPKLTQLRLCINDIKSVIPTVKDNMTCIKCGNSLAVSNKCNGFTIHYFYNDVMKNTTHTLPSTLFSCLLCQKCIVQHTRNSSGVQITVFPTRILPTVSNSTARYFLWLRIQSSEIWCCIVW